MEIFKMFWVRTPWFGWYHSILIVAMDCPLTWIFPSLVRGGPMEVHNLEPGSKGSSAPLQQWTMMEGQGVEAVMNKQRFYIGDELLTRYL